MKDTKKELKEAEYNMPSFYCYSDINGMIECPCGNEIEYEMINQSNPSCSVICEKCKHEYFVDLVVNGVRETSAE